MQDVNNDGLTERKAAVRAFFALVSSSGFGDASNLLSDKAIWWTPSITFDKPGIVKLFGLLESHLVGARFRFECGTMTAENNTVAVEAKSFAKLKNGRDYHNHYHFLFVFDGTKISEIHEHSDSQHGIAVWGDLL